MRCLLHAGGGILHQFYAVAAGYPDIAVPVGEERVPRSNRFKQRAVKPGHASYSLGRDARQEPEMSPFIFDDMLRIPEQRAWCDGGCRDLCLAVRTPVEINSLSLLIRRGSLAHSDIGNEGVPVKSGYAAAVRTEPEYAAAILKNNGDNGRDQAVCNRVGLHLLCVGGVPRCEQDETNYPNGCMN